jgi:hypothetical protein
MAQHYDDSEGGSWFDTWRDRDGGHDVTWFIQREEWEVAAGMLRDMDVVSASILTSEGAVMLAAHLPHTLLLERDGSHWNVVDAELIDFENLDGMNCERCGPLACTMDRHRKVKASS